ncbi:ankyrin repeat domain-containing protein [Candidatus Thiosymbion oneisti]|uniref:ankyrin repeat domain-containing protein n=1 Tax=Candidatus Thiosymbion oneisti TaxID=589554 RepID=UPI000A572667|nr:ankyrin repeat domain-containing protein [Candidatus Thiosymbion oneisti]
MEDTERLIDAVNNGRIEEVRGFLARGASVDTTDTDGDSLLLLAAGEGDLEMVKLLLARGADPLHVGSDGFVVWHWAAYGCSLEIARLLLPLNPHIDLKDYDGITPLGYALMDDCMEVAEFLLVHGADPDSTDDNGRTLLHDAAARGNEKGVRLLLKYGARIDVEDKRGALPCQYVPDDKEELLLKLIPEDGLGDTERLIDAVSNWRVKEVEDFLAGGADVNTTDADGDSLLLLAAAEGDLDMVKLLLERGANPFHVGSKGFTVWHWIPFGCSLEIASLLLPLNRHIDAKAHNGAPPLWYAVGRGCTEIAEFLLTHGADPNHSSPRGRSLLHYAASLGNEKNVRLLLKYGARTDLASKRGVLPYECVPDDKPELLSVLTPENQQVALS